MEIFPLFPLEKVEKWKKLEIFPLLSGVPVLKLWMLLGETIRAEMTTWGHHFRTLISSTRKEILSPDGIKAVLASTAAAVRSSAENPLTDATLGEVARATALSTFKQLLAQSNVISIPKQSDVRAICLYCAKTMSVNSSKMQIHVATKCAEDHPQKEEFKAAIAGTKTAAARLGKRSNEELNLVKEDRDMSERAAGKAPRSGPASSASGISSRGACRTCGCKCGGIEKHMDRELTEAEVKTIDQGLARFCYAEGLAFSVLLSQYLSEVLSKLNASWGRKTKLTDWNLRHRLLTDEAEGVAEKVAAAVASAFVLTLISDGWCGVQKEHQLNIMLATPRPFFIENVFTKVQQPHTRAHRVSLMLQARVRMSRGRVRGCECVKLTPRTFPPPLSLRRMSTSTESTSARSSSGSTRSTVASSRRSALTTRP
jgi:hypothetical protein